MERGEEESWRGEERSRKAQRRRWRAQWMKEYKRMNKRHKKAQWKGNKGGWEVCVCVNSIKDNLVRKKYSDSAATSAAQTKQHSSIVHAGKAWGLILIQIIWNLFTFVVPTVFFFHCFANTFRVFELIRTVFRASLWQWEAEIQVGRGKWGVLEIGVVWMICWMPGLPNQQDPISKPLVANKRCQWYAISLFRWIAHWVDLKVMCAFQHGEAARGRTGRKEQCTESWVLFQCPILGNYTVCHRGNDPWCEALFPIVQRFFPLDPRF